MVRPCPMHRNASGVIGEVPTMWTLCLGIVLGMLVPVWAVGALVLASNGGGWTALLWPFVMLYGLVRRDG